MKKIRTIITCFLVFFVLLIYSTAFGAVNWYSGGEINDPAITSPSSGLTIGVSTEFSCECNTPQDYDCWVDTSNGTYGDSLDESITATWDDGGAGGSFPDGNTGNSVLYVTPSTVPASGKITLTVTFDDDDGVSYADDDEKSKSVDVDIADAKMVFTVGGTEVSEITRGETGSFKVVDSSGNTISGATYANWKSSGDFYTIDGASHSAQTWTGVIVQGGYTECEVTFGGTSVWVSKDFTVKARTGSDWEINPDCSEDVNPDWGDYPGTDVLLGRNEDASNGPLHIIFPRGTNFTEGYTSSNISTGPNGGLWYVTDPTFEIVRHTLINKFAKPGEEGYPNPPGENWYYYNQVYQSVDMPGLLQGLENHEGYGGTSGVGHQQLIEDLEAEDDARAAIEDIFWDSQTGLENDIGSVVETIDEYIDYYSSDGVGIFAGDNWGMEEVYFYNFNLNGWDHWQYGN